MRSFPNINKSSSPTEHPQKLILLVIFNQTENVNKNYDYFLIFKKILKRVLVSYHSTNNINNLVRTYNDRALKIGLYLAMQANLVLSACTLHTTFYCSPSEGREPISNTSMVIVLCHLQTDRRFYFKVLTWSDSTIFS